MVFVGFAALLVVFLLCLAVLLATLVVLVMLPVRMPVAGSIVIAVGICGPEVRSGHTDSGGVSVGSEHDSCSVASSPEGECLRH